MTLCYPSTMDPVYPSSQPTYSFPSTASLLSPEMSRKGLIREFDHVLLTCCATSSQFLSQYRFLEQILNKRLSPQKLRIVLQLIDGLSDASISIHSPHDNVHRSLFAEWIHNAEQVAASPSKEAGESLGASEQFLSSFEQFYLNLRTKLNAVRPSNSHYQWDSLLQDHGFREKLNHLFCTTITYAQAILREKARCFMDV